MAIGIFFHQVVSIFDQPDDDIWTICSRTVKEMFTM